MFDNLIALCPNCHTGAPHVQAKMRVEEINIGLFFEGDEGRLFSLSDLERTILQASKIVERFAKRIKP